MKTILFLLLFSTLGFSSFISPGGGGGGGSGTVTSVDMSVPSILSISGNPITSSGTLAVSLANQSANTVFAGGTSGGAATPTFRSLVIADIPTITSAKGGTGGDSSASTGIAHVASGTWSYSNIVNADVDAAAAIDFSKMANLTVSRALVSDGSGDVSVATTTATEIGYVNGVTSAIQTQLNAKQASDTQLTSLAGLSYSGNSLKVVRVNAGETDFELATITSGVGGSTGATDNRVLRSDGTGGSTLQNSLLAIDDSGRLSLTTSGNVAADIYNDSRTYGGNSTSGSVYGNYTYMLASSTANQDYSAAGSWGTLSVVDGNNNDTAAKGAGGLFGWARGGNYITGTAGIAYSGRGTNARLVGVYGHGDTSVLGGGATLSTSIGGYFSTGTGGGAVVPSGLLSAVVGNNLASTNDIFVGLDNGTEAFAVRDGGIVKLGATSATPKHIINSDTYTAAADALTLLNGPTGKAGDPAGYLKVTVNGTDRAIPFW